MTEFSNKQISQFSEFIQNYMKKNNIGSLTAYPCADLLAENNILPNNVGSKMSFNFQQILRDGREKFIDLVEGAYQVRPKTKWIIFKRR